MNLPICIFLALLCISQLCTSVDGLFCFKCLNIDCSGDDIECQRIRSFIQAELKSFYYFGSYLDPCPQLNETYNWRLMQLDDEPCPEQKANEATCTLGRMQVKTTETDQTGKAKVRYNHATVLGCANRQLLLRIKAAYEEGVSQCDLLKRNQTAVGIVRELEIEHCRDLTTQCYGNDYCIDWKRSVVKSWIDQKQDTRFEFSLIIGILALVVIGMSAIIIAGLCREPASRPSNLPKSIGDESETVKVLQVRDKELSSIEVDDHHRGSFPNGGNGTLSKRPSLPPPPPPPPPRLNRHTRGSTPV